MDEILAGFLSNVEQLSVADYVIIFLLIVYAIHGFMRGFALGFIHFIWLGLGFVFASSFYQPLSENSFLWFLSGYHLLSFVLLFVMFFIGKILFYKLVHNIATIEGPCPLNRFLAIFLGLGIVLNISWVLANDLHYIGSFHSIIANEGLRVIASFLSSVIVIVIGIIVFIKMFDIKVNINRPCPLLATLIPLEAILNAKEIESLANNIFGLLLGLLKGGIMIVLLIIVLHQYNVANGVIANSFNDIAANTTNILSHYLTFIKK